MESTKSCFRVCAIAVSEQKYDLLIRIAEDNDLDLKDLADELIERGLKSSKYRAYAMKPSSQQSRLI